MAKPFTGGSFLGTFGLVFVAIVVLFAVDTFLTRTERAESAIEATRLFEQGRASMERGDNALAIERIQDAIAIERGNRYYQETLAQAQLAAGKTTDAETTLTELLQSDSTDGLTNLIMGRVLAKEGRFPEASSYFHRAIYGQWNQDAAGNSLRVRLELIDLLAQRDSKEDLLAELLPVQDQVPRDLKTRTHMGRLFLLAGSPPRAAEVFHGILLEAPADAGAHEGLGEAEFAQGNYRLAQRDFEAALRLAPDEQAARQRLDLCNQLLMLDPTMRGLDLPERLDRSRKLLQLALDDIQHCIGDNPSPKDRDLLDQAAKALKARAPRPAEASESDLDLAEQLWQVRSKECKTPPPANAPLALVLARLAR